MTKENTEKTTLRPLQARDIFPFSRILSKIGIKRVKGVLDADEVRDAIAAAKGEDGVEGVNVEAVGITVAVELAAIVCERLSDVEQDVYALLASMSVDGLKPDDIAALPLGDFVDMLRELFAKPEFADFLRVAAR